MDLALQITLGCFLPGIGFSVRFAAAHPASANNFTRQLCAPVISFVEVEPMLKSIARNQVVRDLLSGQSQNEE
jgi:hypothetical protein